MNSKADDFRKQIGPSRRQSYHRVSDTLSNADPDLLDAVIAAFKDDSVPTTSIHRALLDLGYDVGYSSVIRWRQHVCG